MAISEPFCGEIGRNGEQSVGAAKRTVSGNAIGGLATATHAVTDSLFHRLERGCRMAFAVGRRTGLCRKKSSSPLKPKEATMDLIVVLLIVLLTAIALVATVIVVVYRRIAEGTRQSIGKGLLASTITAACILAVTYWSAWVQYQANVDIARLKPYATFSQFIEGEACGRFFVVAVLASLCGGVACFISAARLYKNSASSWAHAIGDVVLTTVATSVVVSLLIALEFIPNSH